MIWGYFSASAADTLVFIDEIMTADVYIDISTMKNFPKKRKSKFWKHSFSIRTMAWKMKQIKLSPGYCTNCAQQFWKLPQSPAINPTENYGIVSTKNLVKTYFKQRTVKIKTIRRVEQNFSCVLSKFSLFSIPKIRHAKNKKKTKPYILSIKILTSFQLFD